MVRKTERVLVSVALVFAAALICIGGCSVGPETMPRDRFEYGHALARSAREELLMNIVRFRYMEAPMFMSISSVVNQYSLEGELNGGGQWGWGAGPSSTARVGGAARFADKPTITYAPMVGRHFTESVITPMRPEAVLALVESGWTVKGLFPLTVHSINGIRNRFHVGDNQQALDPRFAQMVDIMAQMQQEGTLSIRVVTPDDESKPTFVLMISIARNDEDNERILELKRMLGLNPDAERYRIVFGSAAKDDTEIAFVTRSILGILADMSSYVEVPEQHILEGRVAPGAPRDESLRHPLIVHSSENEPPDGFVQIRYRDLWFWIDDKDLHSKRTFAVLQLLATLAESPGAAQTPLLTIPAG